MIKITRTLTQNILVEFFQFYQIDIFDFFAAIKHKNINIKKKQNITN